jgi:hypothetical protein
VLGVQQILPTTIGPLPVTKAFSTSGGKILLMPNGSAFATAVNTTLNLSVYIDNNLVDVIYVFANESFTHKALISQPIVVPNLAAGAHTLKLTVGSTNMATDASDYYNVSIIEFN